MDYQIAKFCKFEDRQNITAETVFDFTVALTHNNMGLVYQSQCDHKRAIFHLQKALEMKIKVLGEEHPKVASSMMNVGAQLLLEELDHGGALVLFQKALAIQVKLLGANHIDVASTYSNMANAYSLARDLEKALEYHQKDLEITIRVLGADHVNTSRTYANISGVHHSRGDLEKSLLYGQKALEILKMQGKHQGVHVDADMGKTQMLNGMILSQMGRIGESKKMYAEAKESFRISLGPLHPFTQMASRGERAPHEMAAMQASLMAAMQASAAH